MTTSLAIGTKEEDSATGCTTLADLPALVDTCAEMDGEELGEYVERNWTQGIGNIHGLMHLVKEMKRKFKALDRKKQVNGEYLTIRGFTSFDKWFTKTTGKSRREAYYLLEAEEKKNERNAGRRNAGQKKDTNSVRPAFLAHCAEAKGKLGEIQRQLNKPSKYGEILDVKSLHGQIEPTIDSVFQEFLALISPEGYEILQGDEGWWISKKEQDPKAVEAQKAKRSAAPKKATPTRAANKAAAQPAPAAAPPAASLGECESCCDGTLATEVVNGTYGSKSNECAKCAANSRKSDRKYLIRQMGVAKVMGTFYTLETLAKLGGKPMDFGDGDVRTYPTVADYIARLKENFLGNKNYDQTVVVGHIARQEKRMQEAEK